MTRPISFRPTAGGGHARGAVTVEFAIVSSIAFLFVFASLEFGRMNVIRHTVVNAAYEGARRAIIPNATPADAVAHAQAIMDIVRTQGTSVTVDPPVFSPATTRVSVTVSVPANSNGWIAPLFSWGQLMTGTCTLEREVF
ncbi:MAG TPA: TadE/TadG family type IV pilus assembly protein [Pirellulaceae bacterium]